jgi:hypothetical protein
MALKSGVARCPCCGDDTMVNDLAKPLCDDCIGESCAMTRDASGELGYWECQRPDYDPS